MRKLMVAALLLLGACATGRLATATATAPSTVPWDDLAVLGPLEVALVYFSRSTSPPPTVELANSYQEVCLARGEAERHAALDATWSVLRKAGQEAAARRRWRLTLLQSEVVYDPARAGFSTGLHLGSTTGFGGADYCWQDVRYEVAFVNGLDFSTFPMDTVRAREFLRGNPQRLVTVDLELEVVGVDALAVPTVKVRIHRLRVRDSVTGAVLHDGR